MLSLPQQHPGPPWGHQSQFQGNSMALPRPAQGAAPALCAAARCCSLSCSASGTLQLSTSLRCFLALLTDGQFLPSPSCHKERFKLCISICLQSTEVPFVTPRKQFQALETHLPVHHKQKLIQTRQGSALFVPTPNTSPAKQVSIYKQDHVSLLARLCF